MTRMVQSSFLQSRPFALELLSADKYNLSKKGNLKLKRRNQNALFKMEFQNSETNQL